MISVLVPVYNTEKYLRRCLDSVLAQTFQDFELILVDDGSTDASGRICDEYAAKDERIVVFHQKNKGQAAARNVALDYVLASNYSEWITFIDSDDVVHPQILEMLYLGIIGTSEKLIAGDLQFFKNNERPEFQKKDTSSLTIRSMLPETFFATNHYIETVPVAKLYHRSCFENVRYPEGKIHEDNYVTYKIIFSLGSVLHLEYPIYYYFSNPEGTTKSSWRPARLTVFEAYSQQLDFFHKNGYKEAEKKIVLHYANMLCAQIREAKTSKYRRQYLGLMRDMMKRHLKKYKGYPGMGMRDNFRFYAMEYPFTEIIYRIMKKMRNMMRMK